ncbi:MAG TPA: CYTH and CHAD domain-containing protein [Burkholderiaceae bacterium]|nr:CYTH and CHAD domain-containing protein [Burkholderiaceae bacterium]
MAELEVKLRVPDAALPSLRAALRAHGARAVRMRAHYYDTPDDALARAGVALRLRLEGRRWVQTLKAAGEGVAHRLEHEVAVPGPAARVPALDLGRHDGNEAAAALHAALRGAPASALVERHGTDITRLRCLLRDEQGTEIEAALDTGEARAGERATALAEVELEHKGGPLQGVFDLAASWVGHGGLWLCTTPKAERGRRLLQSRARPVATRARAPRLDPGTDGATLLRATLQSALEQVLANASDLAEGVGAAETIHQARVGLRRLRTVLRELAALSPAVSPDWDGVLAAAFTQLGALRDDQACALAVQPLLQAAHAPLLSWQPRGRADPVACVRDAALQRTLLAILALAHAGDERFAALSPAATRDWLAQRLDDLQRRIARDGRRFHRLAPERQHRERKRLKRLRYLVELSVDLWPREAARRILEPLAAAQDALGHHNDVTVAAAAFRAEAAQQPAAWFAAGYLQAHLAVTARSARRALLEVAQAKPCWR